MATLIQFLLLLLPLCRGSLTQIPDDLTVVTLNGKVHGARLSVLGHDVRAFLGIPYALPPLGELRFRPPKPTANWEGVKNAANFSNSCYQLPDTVYEGFSGTEAWNPNTPLSEDCLYLNIWTPVPTSGTQKPLPVLVWIYGGGFVSGTASLALYDGRFLSQSENVVVVSMNYRLGAFGFLALPENDNIRGNAGLLDQQMALRWVADNVASFGGDPSMVTLFGESAGAASVGYHLLSPGSHALFKRAVLQSGCPTAPWASLSQTKAWERAGTLGSLLGCRPSPAAELERCLQRASALDIVKRQFEVLTEPSLIVIPFPPTVDGDFLPDKPEVMLNTGKFKKTEVLFGLNKDEGSFFLLYGMPGCNLTGQSLISREKFLKGIPLALPGSSDLAKEAAVFVYTNWSDVKNETLNRDAMSALMGHQHFNCPTVEFTRRYSEHGGEAFLYLFDHRSSNNPWPLWMGVLHADEIQFVFGMPLNASLEFNEKEVNMSRSIMKHWANFARTGNPSNGAAPWPLYRAESEVYMTLNTNPPQQKSKMTAQQCQFLTHLLPKIQRESDRTSCMVSSGTPACSCMFFLVGLMLLTFSLLIA